MLSLCLLLLTPCDPQGGLNPEPIPSAFLLYYPPDYVPEREVRVGLYELLYQPPGFVMPTKFWRPLGWAERTERQRGRTLALRLWPGMSMAEVDGVLGPPSGFVGRSLGNTWWSTWDQYGITVHYRQSFDENVVESIDIANWWE